ncbi:hypothetical protein M1O56_04125 [Dehalococcoidia bacterium]|nr:hypothetical protein [Dehalococcoidia bacterium]MCL0078835.1 hypothetical protein [Dehalococcoidia bacterium]
MANDRRETFLAEAARMYDEIMLWNEEHAEGSLEELESFLREKRLALMSHLLTNVLELRAEKLAEEPHPSPSCGVLMASEALRARYAQTLEGEARFQRAYYSCRTCSEWISPLDRHLGLDRSAWSRSIQEGITALRISLPVRRAANIFQDLTGIWISPSTVYRLNHKKKTSLPLKQIKQS